MGTGSRSLSGTSMACPHVSGGAALVLEGNPQKTPAEVLSDLVDRSEKNALTNLRPGDVNVLLWVGSNPVPVPAPTPAPPPALECPAHSSLRWPNINGDCLCALGLCSTDRTTRNCPSSGGNGAFGGRYFLPTCEACRCYRSLPAPPPALECPDFAVGRQPDRDGDCRCANSSLCSTDRRTRNCPSS